MNICLKRRWENACISSFNSTGCSIINCFVQYIAVPIIMYNVEKKLNEMNKEGRPTGGTLYFGLGFCEVIENYKPTDKQ